MYTGTSSFKLHGLLNQLVSSGGQPTLLRWLASHEFAASDHWQYFTDGLEKSIVYRAITTLRDGDRERVTWLFNQLALCDRHKFLTFVANIPRRRIPDLILPAEILPTESISFQISLLVLLRSCCAAGKRAAWLDEDVHRRSLIVCLHAIRQIAMAPNIPNLEFMRAHLADTGLMHELWYNFDNSVRITSRSICALVARQIVRKRQLEKAERQWLQEVTGDSSNTTLEANITATVRDQMNLISFVYAALPNYASHLSSEDATSFKETLAVLLDVGTDFTSKNWIMRLSEEIERIHQYYPEGASDRLKLMFPSYVTPP